MPDDPELLPIPTMTPDRWKTFSEEERQAHLANVRQISAKNKAVKRARRAAIQKEDQRQLHALRAWNLTRGNKGIMGLSASEHQEWVTHRDSFKLP
jgi:hypothetical protein